MDTLWENDDFTVGAPLNPHIPYSEGLHLVIAPKQGLARAWDDPDLAGRTFTLAAKACAVAQDLGLAPWFNLQVNGNWGLLPGNKLSFHVHVLGRNKTDTWAKPIVLPETPGSYHNEPMPEQDRSRLAEAFRTQLG